MFIQWSGRGQAGAPTKVDAALGLADGLVVGVPEGAEVGPVEGSVVGAWHGFRVG